MQDKKLVRRKKIRSRIRKIVTGTAERPRLSVFRSNKSIYAQLIDDVNGHTIAAASSRESGVDAKSNKVEQATSVGKIVAEKAKAAGITAVTFDRGGYLYHGRIKALADGAREAGLQF
ncbi:MAG: 50S ribosomal protein L18 [Bacteroidia bacterium]|jgi:large subunit ribosomal protein L18|nr:50S ribosomal protein L18 [Bacteroidota bacterium]MBP7245233.1 50S ribosomal protein L18 [Bacteroidia bacterium]